jgi:hypothetical protein
MVMKTRTALAAGALGLVATLALPPAALAQHQGDGFLFRQPIGSLALRMGFARPNATSDVYSFLTDQTTLSRNSFAALALAADLSFHATARLDIVLSAGWSGSNAASEMRHWLGPNNDPIQQTTTLQRVPLTASVKYYLLPTGRAVSRFAWVPARYSPYVGAGGGVMYYRLHQWGNFVDPGDSTIFNDAFNASDWTGTVHAFAGVDMAVGPRFVLSGEARYTWAKGALGSDFSEFDRIDLSGFSLTAGVAVRF